MMRDIPIETLRQLLRYEPETGKLYWLERPVEMFVPTPARSAQHLWRWWNNRFAGKEALITTHCDWRHKEGRIFTHTFKAHRVIWALWYGEWPQHTIDHINGDPADNRIENLRDVPMAENARNKGLYKSNRSGMHGVTWYKPYGKWVSAIRINGKRKHLGYFDALDDAVAARETAERDSGLFHENHGRAA